MHRFVIDCGIVNDMFDESNSTLFHLVGEVELMKNLELIHRLLLRFGSCCEGIHSDVRIRIANQGR
jgi:hypothetical protein